MALNKNIKVKLPDSKWVLSKPNANGDRYVRYLISTKRVNSKNVNVKRCIIGIYDEESNMLIPNNNYYKLFDENPVSSFLPSFVRSYGNYYLLYKISSECSLLDIMKTTFPKFWDKILNIAFYMVCENDAMYYIDDYCDENYLLNDTHVNSVETSRIFSQIDEKLKISFLSQWVNKRAENECIAYDITSISSYSKDISYIDYGYNRDGESLPQINLGLFYGMNSNLPLLYDIYNGSLQDKTHFEKMMKYASSYKLNNISLIMDRGFYKLSNLEYLYTNNIPFIMGISLSIKEVKEELEKNKDTVKSFKYSLKDNDTFGMAINITINNKPYKLHLYYDQYKSADESNIIKTKITKLENELKQLINKPLDSKRYDKFFKLVINDNILKSYGLNYDAIDEILSTTGYFSLLSSRLDLDSKEILDLYRRKDLIEKTFDNLKNYIDCNRLRVHHDETVNGKIFITFISLILKSIIDSKIKNIPVKKVINELKKIKIQKLLNGSEYISPLTKKQKEIIKLFNITENELKESVNQFPL